MEAHTLADSLKLLPTFSPKLAKHTASAKIEAITSEETNDDYASHWKLPQVPQGQSEEEAADEEDQSLDIWIGDPGNTLETVPKEYKVRRQQRQEMKEEMNQVLNNWLRKHGFSRDVTEPRTPKGCLFWKEETFWPIHVAARLGDAEIVRLLLAAGAEPKQRTSKGRTATDLALEADFFGSHRAVFQTMELQVKTMGLREAIRQMEG